MEHLKDFFNKCNCCCSGRRKKNRNNTNNNQSLQSTANDSPAIELQNPSSANLLVAGKPNLVNSPEPITERPEEEITETIINRNNSNASLPLPNQEQNLAKSEVNTKEVVNEGKGIVAGESSSSPIFREENLCFENPYQQNYGKNVDDFMFISWLKDEKQLITDKLNKEEIKKLRQEYNQLWVDIHEGFQYESNQKPWKKSRFTLQQVKEWIEIGFTPWDSRDVLNWKKCGFDHQTTKEWKEAFKKDFTVKDFAFCNWLRDEKKLIPQIVKEQIDTKSLKQEYNKLWTDIHKDFAKKEHWGVIKFEEYHQQDWEAIGIDYLEAQEWINISGLEPKDTDYIKWMKNTKKVNAEWVLNNIDENNEKRDLCRRYGLCNECQQPNTGFGSPNVYRWCQFCSTKYFKQEFKNWSSGNQNVDDFIRENQLSAVGYENLLEWIPYEQFTNIEYLAEGGFGTVFKAKRNKGSIEYWDSENNRLGRSDSKWSTNNVALKILHNSQDISTDFLQEIAKHKLVDGSGGVVRCYGISKDPNTNNYAIVMNYIKGENIRNFFSSNDYKNSSKSQNKKGKFEDRIKRLLNISHGLNIIHKKGIVHRDLHPGNVLCRNYYEAYITDLGLSKPANSANDRKIYGILPYIAPEILKEAFKNENSRKVHYTQESDIYSFSMIAYEIFSGSPPYHYLPHDASLASQICEGFRPDLDVVKIPSLLKELVAKCWNTDLLIRPKADELEKILNKWYHEMYYSRDAEFYKQFKEIEKEIEFNEIEISRPSISKLLDFTNILTSQYSFQGIIFAVVEEIKSIKEKLENFKQTLNNEIKELVNQFIEINKQLVTNKDDEEAMNNMAELHQLLEEKGLSDQEIENLVEWSERLVKLEQQLEQNQLQAQIEIPAK